MQYARMLGAIVLMMMTLALPAWSNGDLFFEAQENPGKPEYVIFGNVKDDQGHHLPGATVKVSISHPELYYDTQTALLGRYRTLDVGKAVRGLGYDFDPSHVEVTVIYPGYHTVSRLSRGKYRQDKGAVEMNFVMAKDEE
jgi:hypothetical protein